MKTTALAGLPRERLSPAPRVLDRVAEHAVRKRLASLQHGRLTLVDGGAAVSVGNPTAQCPLSATAEVHDPRFYSEIAYGGSIGAGEAYMQGYWSADDLTAVMRILLHNRDVLDGMESGLARFAAPLQKALHWAARNTRGGSRRNIAAHYDLGNEFFSLFLDPTLMYSSAVFERAGMTLEEASIAKLDRICRRLALKASDHVIEIGTGWGGFALHAAARYGCRVTTTTISANQYELARARIADAGLADRITLLREDYRDLRGQYDKLVSIEMIEAVGHQFFDTYFQQCSALLKPDGMMMLQAITIADQRYAAARDSVDFIKRHIFPGCCIPSVAVICDSIARVTDLRLYHLDDMGPHYATTLRAWRENMFARLHQVRALNLPETFIRMWEFYFCYCEAGFAEHATGDVQMLFVKPLARPSYG
jgi:cyclopropane-fatty-acyl-phospholipid synthase